MRKRRLEHKDDSDNDETSGADEEPYKRRAPKFCCTLSFDDFVILRKGHRVTFFADITTKTVGHVMQLLREAEELIKAGLCDTNYVEIEIASEGGCSFSGLILFDLILQMSVDVRAVVCGQCCSAATLMLLACSDRCMLPHSFLLLHDISYGVEGSRREIEREVLNTRMVSNHYRSIYLSRSNLTAELLDREMSHEGILTAEEALKMGLIDRICGTKRLKKRSRRT